MVRLLVGLLVLVATATPAPAHQGLPDEGNAGLVHACTKAGRHGRLRMLFVGPTGRCPRKWNPVHWPTDAGVAALLDSALPETTTTVTTTTTIATTTTTAPPAWTPVADNPGAAGIHAGNPCSTNQTAAFCGSLGASYYGFFNYGGPWARAAFYKDALGVVHLKGLVRNYNADVGYPQVFILPEGYRPSETRLFSAICYDSDKGEGGSCRVDVTPAGVVKYVLGVLPIEYLSLEGISFRAD